MAGAATVVPGLVRGLNAPLRRGGSRVELAPAGRDRLRLDSQWRFTLGESIDPAMGFGANAGQADYAKGGGLFVASNARFDDSAWQLVDLPHDWAIDLPFASDLRLSNWGFKPLHRAYPQTSVGWYRRVFSLPASDAGRRLSIEFDGVFRDCTIALNGFLLGRNLGGYVPFRFDITDVANVGGTNVLVVHVDAREHEGWFYEGAGIYRHVWLVKTSPVHVPQWGTCVRSEVAGRNATVEVRTEIANESDAAATVRAVSAIVDASGREVARVASDATVGGWDRKEHVQRTSIANAALWSIETPNLYTLITTLEVGGTALDRYETRFGVRSIHFDGTTGFALNGKRVEIKGTCNHHDHAGIGAALPDRMHTYRVERLQSMGSNAYRASHNPPTPELLDACDARGMMVVDETRMFGASEEALSQLERMIRRDRNHPSIIAWCIANEEPSQGSERGQAIATTMVRLVRQLDPTRPITAAMDNGWGRGITNAVDIQGFNYRATQTDAFHGSRPAMAIWGTETGSTLCTRGVYANDAQRGYVSAYDVNAPWWASTAEAWYTHFAPRAWIAGGFVWTGFDYRGEPTPYTWPCINSHFGILDTCGFEKDNYYYYKSQWVNEPVLHVFPHWNWQGKEGQEIEVWCHTNLDRVELFVNDKSLGARDVLAHSHASWKVPYAPGVLKAVAYQGEKALLTQTRETTGAPARVELRADRTRLAADGEDVAVISASVVDAQGRVVPTAGDEIEFRVSGSGRLLGVGNGDPSSHESDRGPRRRAFNGLCMAIVQTSASAGPLRVEATSGRLTSTTLELSCQPATPRPSA